MIKVIDNEIRQYRLPKTGTLSTGETVSGYNLLPIETLKAEGWLPLEDIQPEYDEETQYLVQDGYEVLEDKVIKKYKIENIPEPQEPEPSEIVLLKDENKLLKGQVLANADVLEFQEEVIFELIMKVYD